MVEIDDDLDERITCVKDDIKSQMLELAAENPDMSWRKLVDSLRDNVSEEVDSSVPIYTSAIDGLYYLYGDEFESAYQDAGIWDGTEKNHKQSAIYCYIEQQVNEWIEDELKDLIEGDEITRVREYLSGVSHKIPDAVAVRMVQLTIKYLEA
jgi:hypothetical protein